MSEPWTQGADRSVPAEIEDVLALSPLQEGLFSLARLASGGVDVYSMQFVVDIGGPLDVQLLRRAVEALLERHPNLRAAFWDRDLSRPVQIVPTWVALPWSEISCSPEEFDGIAEADRHRNFDLSSGPALRVTLVMLPDGRRRMILTVHHILMDGWAMAVFFRELIAVYEAGGQADSLPAARPYRHYIGWLATRDTTGALAAWTDYLKPLTGPLMLAEADTAVGEAIASRTRTSLGPAATDRLVRWARASGLTTSTVVQFAWAVVLSRMSDRRDVVFGTTVSGRPDGLAGVETMVGLFINTVPVRIVLDAARSVREHCLQAQREQAAMREAGHLSLSAIQRAAGHGALFDVLFVFENAPIGAATDPIVAADGTRFLPVAMESLVHYPLSVVSHLTDGDLVVMVEAVPAALPHFLPAEIAARILAVLQQLPDLADRGPDLLDVLLPDELAALHRDDGTSRSLVDDAPSSLVTPARPWPESTGTQEIAGDPDRASGNVVELFLRQAATTPDAPALSTSEELYTYRQLDEASGSLAAELAAHSIGPESTVALALPRSARSIVAILAVLRAGGAYVPVDISAPGARIASILRQADPDLVLTVDSCRGFLPDSDALRSDRLVVLDDPVVAARIGAHRAVPARYLHRQSRAYLIFTSGSTGEPKGVIGTHAALASYFADHYARVYRPARSRLGRRLRIAHAWSLSFDASWQPLIGLFDGHEVHLFDEAEMRDARGIVDGVARRRIDMIDTSPSMFTQLASAGLVDGDHLTVLALGGEAIGAAMWERLRALPSTAVYNCYGPTETTVEAVVATVNSGAGDSITSASPVIGDPVDRMRGYLLDSRLRPVPRGAVGELYLSGAQLTRGYAGRPALTADRFVADPFLRGARMYRTGDLVRRSPTGGLAYLGRADDQVKIRGYRIELGDIESVMVRLAGVCEAAVVVVQRASGPALVGFVVPAGDHRGAHIGDSAGLRTELSRLLPAYMVPAQIIAVPALPVTPNGKLDVGALVAHGRDALGAIGSRGAGTPPRTETERALCTAFGEALGSRNLGIDDDLLDLGIDSIVAISLVDRARRAGLRIAPAMVLSASTIRDLAAAVDSRVTQEPSRRAAAYGPVVPTPIMSWMYEYGRFRRLTLSTLVSLPEGIDRAALETVLQSVIDGHDLLRATLTETDGAKILLTRPPGSVAAADVLTEVRVDGEVGPALELHSRTAIDGIDPRAGAMLRAVRFHRPAGDMLLLSIHHLAVDPVSWRIILADLAEAWGRVAAIDPGHKPAGMTGSAPEGTTYREWANLLAARAELPEVLAQREFWAAQRSHPDPPLGRRRPDPRTDTWSSYRISPSFTDPVRTRRLLDALGRDGRPSLPEFLLAAVVLTLTDWRVERGQDGGSGVSVALEGHGREDALLGADTSRTVGWFTTVYPLHLPAPPDRNDPAVAAQLLDTVAARLRSVPNKGLDYGQLRYGSAAPELAAAGDPQVLFDYLGRLDLAASDTDAPWAPIADLALHERLPVAPEPDMPLRYALDVITAIHPGSDGPRLVALWRWSDALFDATEIDRLSEIWQHTVATLAAAVLDGPVLQVSTWEG